MGFTKLFGSIIHSTIWRAPDHIRLVWITMLAMADRDGIVEAAVPGLADAARVTLEQCEDALTKFQSADPYSRTPDHDGRRIEVVRGGWRLLNYDLYRQRMNKEDQREKTAERVRRHRARKATESLDVTPCNECNDIADAEADAEADAKEEGEGSDARAIVDLLCKSWPEWPREQAEASYMRLRGGHPDIALKDWPAIIRAAFTAAAPDMRPDRIHTWLNRQAGFHVRDVAAQKSPGSPAAGGRYVPDPSTAWSRDTSTAGPTPEERATKDYVDALVASTGVSGRINSRADEREEEESDETL